MPSHATSVPAVNTCETIIQINMPCGIWFFFSHDCSPLLKSQTVSTRHLHRTQVQVSTQRIINKRRFLSAFVFNRFPYMRLYRIHPLPMLLSWFAMPIRWLYGIHKLESVILRPSFAHPSSWRLSLPLHHAPFPTPNSLLFYTIKTSAPS